MVMTDPIADMLTRIRNAVMVRKKEVEIPASKMKVAIARIMKEEGYIAGYEVIDDGKQGILKIKLKYTPDRKSVIHGLERVSKPGRRVYCDKDSIPHVLDGMGIAILSTSKGIMTDKQAEKLGIGGEVICYIW